MNTVGVCFLGSIHQTIFTGLGFGKIVDGHPKHGGSFEIVAAERTGRRGIDIADQHQRLAVVGIDGQRLPGVVAGFLEIVLLGIDIQGILIIVVFQQGLIGFLLHGLFVI